MVSRQWIRVTSISTALPTNLRESPLEHVGAWGMDLLPWHSLGARACSRQKLSVRGRRGVLGVAARLTAAAFRREHPEKSAVVPRELAHVGEAPIIGNAGNAAVRRIVLQRAAHLVETQAAHVGEGWDAGHILESVLQSAARDVQTLAQLWNGGGFPGSLSTRWRTRSTVR